MRFPAIRMSVWVGCGRLPPYPSGQLDASHDLVCSGPLLDVQTRHCSSVLHRRWFQRHVSTHTHTHTHTRTHTRTHTHVHTRTYTRMHVGMTRITDSRNVVCPVHGDICLHFCTQASAAGVDEYVVNDKCTTGHLNRWNLVG